MTSDEPCPRCGLDPGSAECHCWDSELATERRYRDIQTLEGVRKPFDMNLGEVTAMVRQLPAMLAALRFVEEHGSAAQYALESLGKMPSSFSYYVEHSNALDALDRLRAALRKP